MTKVFFANRQEIEDCFLMHERRKREAQAFAKSRLQNGLLEKLRSTTGHDWFNLGDIAGILKVEKPSEAAVTITVQPRTMAELRRTQCLPKNVELRYLY